MSVEVGYVGNRGRQRVRGRRAGHQHQPGDARTAIPRACRRTIAPARTSRLAVRVDAGHRLLLQLRQQRVRLAAGEVHQALLATATRCNANYTLQRAEQDDGDYFRRLPERRIVDSAQRGPADWDRTHNFVLSLVAELPFGRGRPYLSDISPLADAVLGGWQFNTNTSSRAACRSTSPTATPAPIATPARTGRTSSAIRKDPRRATSGSTPRRSARPGSAFGRPARGHVRRPGAQLAARARATGGSTRRSSSTSRSATAGARGADRGRSTCSTT